MKLKLLAIIIAAVLLVGAGTGIGIAVYANQPENVVEAAISDLFDDLLDRDEIKPLYNTLSGGSLDVAISSAKMDETDLLDGGSISGKLYFSDDAFMIEGLNVKYGDNKINGDLYFSNEMVYVSEKEILGGAYGVKLKQIADEIKDSIFAFGSESKYAITDEEEYEAFIDAIDSVGDGKLKKDAEKLFNKLADKFWDIAGDNFEFESEVEKVRVGGTREKARVITIEINGTSFANAVADFYDYLVEDDSVAEFLEKYEDVLSNRFGSDDDKPFAEQFDDALEEFGEELAENLDEIESHFGRDMTITVITPRTSTRLAKLEIKVGEEEVLSLDIGMEGIAKSEKITLTADGERLTYEIIKNNSKQYECELSMGQSSVNFLLDKKNDEFTLTAEEEPSYGLYKFVVKGTLKASLGKTTITVNKIETSRMGESDIDDPFYGDISVVKSITETIECEATIVLDYKDRFPSEPKDYQKISEITEEDVDAWIEKFSKFEP